MDISQSFGSSSSYARKYALSALFLLDDTKDADATNTHNKEIQATYVQLANSGTTGGNSIAHCTNMHDAVKIVEQKLKPILKVGTELFDKCRAGYLKDAKNLIAIQERYSMNDETFEALTAK